MKNICQIFFFFILNYVNFNTNLNLLVNALSISVNEKVKMDLYSNESDNNYFNDNGLQKVDDKNETNNSINQINHEEEYDKITREIFSRPSLLKQVNNYEELEYLVKNEKLFFLEIYSPGCWHCQNLAPKLEKIVLKFKDKFKLFRMDGSDSSNYRSLVKLQFFPSLYIFKDNNFNLFKGSSDNSLEIENFMDKLFNFNCNLIKDIHNDMVRYNLVNSLKKSHRSIFGVFNSNVVTELFQSLINNHIYDIDYCFYFEIQKDTDNGLETKESIISEISMIKKFVNFSLNELILDLDDFGIKEFKINNVFYINIPPNEIVIKNKFLKTYTKNIFTEFELVEAEFTRIIHESKNNDNNHIDNNNNNNSNSKIDTLINNRNSTELENEIVKYNSSHNKEKIQVQINDESFIIKLIKESFKNFIYNNNVPFIRNYYHDYTFSIFNDISKPFIIFAYRNHEDFEILYQYIKLVLETNLINQNFKIILFDSDVNTFFNSYDLSKSFNYMIVDLKYKIFIENDKPFSVFSFLKFFEQYETNLLNQKEIKKKAKNEYKSQINNASASNTDSNLNKENKRISPKIVNNISEVNEIFVSDNENKNSEIINQNSTLKYDYLSSSKSNDFLNQRKIMDKLSIYLIYLVIYCILFWFFYWKTQTPDNFKSKQPNKSNLV